VRYPAYVDPPFTGVRVNYTFTDAAYPGQSYWNGSGASDSYFHVGYIDAANSPDDGKAHTTRSYWSMAIDGLAGRHIVSAALDTFEEKAYSCTGSEVDVYTSAAVSASTTWNNQPSSGTFVDNATTAHGASGCAAAPVGFDAAAAVQAAADAGQTRLWLMMKAASETSDYGWKKFDNDPTLEIVYQSPPSVPAGRSVNGCYVQCTEPVLTHRNQPTITAYSTGDAGSYDYTFKIYAGHSSSPTSLATSVAVTNVPAGQIASWVVTTVAANHALYDGDFEYEAHACVYNTHVCGDWSSFFTFTVDTQRPAAPTATSTDFQLYAAPPNPTPTARVGNEGVPGVVRVGSNGSTDDYAYVYSPQSSLSEAAIPACGAVADVITTCSLAADHSLSVSIAPTEFTSTLSLLAIDRAGNISDGSTYTYYPNGTLANSPQHGWVDSGSQLGNTNVSDWSGAASPQAMGLHGGAAWVSPAAKGPYVNHGSYNEALSFDGVVGTEADASTTDVTADVTHSATMAVWAKPATSGSGPNQTVFSQDGPSASGFYLQMAGQHWRMCMPRAGTPVSSDCTAISDPATMVTPGVWTLLVGVWDAPMRQMTLYVITKQATFSTTQLHTSIAAGSTGQVVLGRAMASGVQTDRYVGQAADLLIYDVALGDPQLEALQGDLPASLGG
ncbi:MAG: DNRLRE domain-containing protein, partial [Jatrophihabitantaceae bacterium]